MLPMVGVGVDVHPYADPELGRELALACLTWPGENGLAGHSDADVLLHAITDALLGAAALGDIGMHFPDTDPQWKGAQSDVFLKHAAALVRDRGYGIVNVDSTVIAERPKLKDYRTPIRERVAAVMEIELDRVSLKFKTSERVGPVGEGRSVEAHAVVTISRTG